MGNGPNLSDKSNPDLHAVPPRLQGPDQVPNPEDHIAGSNSLGADSVITTISANLHSTPIGLGIGIQDKNHFSILANELLDS